MVSDRSRTRPPPAKHPVLRILLALAGVLLLALIALAGWLFATESGARAAFSALASLSGGMLRAEGVHGRLGSPLRLDKLTLQQADRRITLSGLRLDWHPLALTHSTLDIESLALARLDVVTRSSSEPSSAFALPNNIGLPLTVHLRHARIDDVEVVSNGSSLLHFKPLAFAADFDGKRYRLRLQQLDADARLASGTVAASLSGEATLASRKPHALQGSFSTRARAALGQQPLAATGRVGLSGSLADLGLALDASVNQARLTGRATLHPFSEEMLGAAQLDAQDLDLARFGKALPSTALDLKLTSAADGNGELNLSNRAAGAYDAHKLPVSSLAVTFRRQGKAIDFPHIALAFGTATQPAGTLQGSGGYRDNALTLALHADGIDLKRLDSSAQATNLSGDIGLRDDDGRQTFRIALGEPLNGRRIALDAQGALANSVLTLDRLALQAGAGRVEASARLALDGDRGFSAKGRFDHFRLSELGDFPQLPSLDLNGGFSLQGAQQPQLQADLSFDIRDSHLAGQPLVGNGALQLRGERLQVHKFLLASGANRLSIDGRLEQEDSQLSFDLDAPRLAQLGPDLSGALGVSGVVRGSLAQPRIRAEWHADHAHLPKQLQIDSMQGRAEIGIDTRQPFALQSVDGDISAHGLRYGADRVAAAALQLHFAPRPDAPLALTLRLQGIAAAGLQADRMQVSAHGTPARHDIDALLDQAGQAWKLGAQGSVTDLKSAPRWQGSIGRFDANGRFNAHLAAPAALALSAQQAQLDHFVLDTDSGRLALEQFARDAGGITSRGRIESLRLASLLQQFAAAPPVRTDLQFSGEWNVQIGKTLQGEVRLRRDSGDLTVLGSSPVTLRLRTLSASASAAGDRVELQLQLDGKQLGQVTADAATRIGDASGRFALASDAPLSGKLHIDIPSLAWIGPLASPSLIVGGSLHSDVGIGGSVGTPALSGGIDGKDLRLTFADLGLDLAQGALRGEFQGEQLLLRNLSFRSEKGKIELSGPIGLHEGALAAQLALNADHYQLLNRVDRRITFSGNSRIAVQDKRASATGAFTVDAGYVDIGQADKPQLSDDVVIVGAKPKEAPALGLALDLTVGLGDGVKLTGRGLEGMLTGKIHLRSNAGEALAAYGTLRIVKGTFSAYGRELKIEQGEVRFSGPLDNPTLNILAMRRGQEVEAGVSVRGSVLAPSISLVSEPDVPDADKLSWLVLGRDLSSAGTSDVGTLQSAAGSLLSKGAAAGVQSRIANALGLDTVSVGTSDDNLQQRIVTLGKKISSRLYVSYEQGLQSADNVVQLRYLLTPKLSLEAEAGTRSALSLFYNITFD